MEKSVKLDDMQRRYCSIKEISEDKYMSYFYEPVNVNQWNMFEKVKSVGHIEPFLATSKMQCGDIIFLHVGSQNKKYESGIYAYGIVVNGPYILENHPEDYCNEKNTVDVEIKKINYSIPYVSHQECKDKINQFRTVHMLSEENGELLMKLLKTK